MFSRRKKSFEKFWFNKFKDTVENVCEDYRFILVNIGSNKNVRAEAQLRLHNVKVARFVELP